jgi:hypothetical protein
VHPKIDLCFIKLPEIPGERDEPSAPVRVDCGELKRSATAKDAQLSRITWNSMVLVVSQHNLPKPGTDFCRAMMLPALKLSPNGFELRDHPLLRRGPPDDQSSVGELPTEAGEAQEYEGLWFSLSALLPVSSGKPPELDQSCLVRM